jgi:nucleoside-diphosphate-sugar epimerase
MKGVIIGLGRVGLPVSQYLAKRFDLTGIDISPVEGFPGDLLQLDVTDGSPATTQSLEDAITGSDFVLYTAIAHPGFDEFSEIAYWAVNTHGAGRVFALCARHGVARLVYYSSLSVYNKPRFNHIDALTEEITPNPGIIPVEEGNRRIAAFYAHTKFAGEQQLAKHSSVQSKGIVLRLMGPVTGEAFKRRDHWRLTHMDDVSQATERAIIAPLADGDDPFNFGVFHIAQDHPDSNVSVERARAVLGYNPRHRNRGTRS